MTEKEMGELVQAINIVHPTFAPNREAAIKIVKLWHRIIGHIPFVDAEKYLIDHFAESRFPPLPVDIIRRHKESFDPDKPVIQTATDDEIAAYYYGEGRGSNDS